MASIFKRGKTWSISYHLNDKQVMKSLKTRSKKIAELAKKEIERRLAVRNLRQILYNLYDESENCCQICGYDLIVEEHHFIPRAQGGSNFPGNLVKLCPNHHRLLHLALDTLNGNKNKKNNKELKERLKRILRIDDDFAFFYRKNAAQFEQMKNNNEE